MSAVRGLVKATSVVSLVMSGIACVPISAWAQFEDENLSLKIDPPRRYFMRFGYTYVEPNDKSGDTRDKSGPLIRYNEHTYYTNPTAQNIMTRRFANGPVGTASLAMQNLSNGMNTDLNGNVSASTGLGVPVGVQGDAKGAGSPTVSAGMFLDEQHKWAVETFVLALPFENDIYGAGRIGGDVKKYPGLANYSSPQGTPESGAAVDLGKVMSTKQLPLTFLAHRYFGDKKAKFRPSVGVGLTYAIFFDSQASESLERWAGGPTKVKIKNAFGAGLFLGGQYALTDRWHLSGFVGYEKIKTTATLTTNTLPDLLADSSVNYQSAADIGSSTTGAIDLSNNTNTNPSSNYGGNGPNPEFGKPVVSTTKATLRQLAKARAAQYGTDPNSLGTYVREIDQKLDPWVFNVSIGYSF